MKKPINLFGRVLSALVLCAGLVVTGCYDDSAVLGQIGKHDEQLKDLDSRVEELERLTAQQNTNLESLQTIVNALQERDYVTSVAPIKEGDDVIGYTITFSKSGAVTIYSGEDGYVPAMGVKKDESDGQWYWTVDGEWMKDSEGKRVRASATDGEDGEDGNQGEQGEQGETGVTPQLKIIDGYWYVSYDGGESWEEETLGQATGDKGYTMFAEVSYDDNYLYITMSDGQKLTLPRASSSQGEGGEGEGDVVQVGPVTMKLSEITASTVTFIGTITDVKAIPYIEKITVYYKEASETFSIFSANSASTSRLNSDNTVSITIRLPYNTSYSYCLYVKSRGVETYNDVNQFTTVNVVPAVSVVESSITATTASFSGTVSGLSDVDKSLIQVGMAYSSVSGDFQSDKSTKVASGEISEEGTYSMSIDELAYGTKYYFCSYVKQNGVYKYGEVKELVTIGITLSTPSDATDLSASSTANCYIVSQSGKYCFKIYKGNSSDFIGRGEDVPQGFPSSAAVLWETFGTSTTPSVSDLVKNVTYKDGYISFEATDKKGNAVIAAKDAAGKILWSWHIWLTDQPEAQVYSNNAGTMMDRNLGATSATPGDVRALGLLYQWGRKDPFLGSSSISDDIDAKSTLSWPSAVSTSSSTGTIDYVTANPTTFVTCYSNNFDWHYGSRNNDLWKSVKTIYDPCPAGWRVPDGGSSGVWKTAGFDDTTYDWTNKGISFSISSPSTTWYPASGCRYYGDGGLGNVGYNGDYWSVTPSSINACYLDFSSSGDVYPSFNYHRAYGRSVRCLQESL